MLDEDEIKWVKSVMISNNKVIGEAIDFVTRHPEATIEISLGSGKSAIEYLVQIYEINPDDVDMYQMFGEEEETSYSIDIYRYENESRALIGRAYLDN